MSKRIDRSDLKTNYARLPNAMLQDSGLSLAARGALALMFSQSDEFIDPTIRGLTQASGCTAHEARKILSELEREGYLARPKIQRSGRWTTDVRLTDCRLPAAGAPVVGPPDVGPPVVGFQQLSTKQPRETTKERDRFELAGSTRSPGDAERLRYAGIEKYPWLTAFQVIELKEMHGSDWESHVPPDPLGDKIT